MIHRAHARYQEGGLDPESELIVRHASLIDTCVRMLVARTGAHQHQGDLWTAGALGLVDAWRRYDPQQQTKFETFASHRVRGAMLDELRKLDHLPRRLRARTEEVKKKRAELGQRLGREPDPSELAASLDIEISELDALNAIARPHANVDDVQKSLAWMPQTDDEIEKKQLLARLTAHIADLPERLQMVLGLRYTEGLTMKEIAALMQVSEPRISQLHSEAVKQLKSRLA